MVGSIQGSGQGNIFDGKSLKEFLVRWSSKPIMKNVAKAQVICQGDNYSNITTIQNIGKGHYYSNAVTEDEIRISGKLICSKKENPKEWASLGHSKCVTTRWRHTYINGRKVIFSEGRLESRFAAFMRRVRRLLALGVGFAVVGIWIKSRVGRSGEEEELGGEVAEREKKTANS